MKKRTILVVDDETETAEAIKAGLEARDAFSVEIAPGGYDALRSVAASLPDAIVLAVTLPDLSAPDVCRVIRARERTARLPIIILGERTDGIGLIDGLELGADDYVAKPLNVMELEARLKAVLARHVHVSYPDHDRFRGLHLDVNFTDVAVAVNDDVVQLTRREFQVLRYLVHHRNRVIGRDVLLTHVWPASVQAHRVVDSAIYKLRNKLCEAGRQIETVVGFGYRFNEPPKDMPDRKGRI